MVVGAERQADTPGEVGTESAAAIVVLLGRLGSSLHEAFMAEVDDRDVVDNAPLMVLFDLALSGPRRPTDIQRLTGMSSGGITKLLDRLEDRGVVHRLDVHPSGDRRGVTVVLTPPGRRLVARLSRRLDAHIEEVRSFSEQLRAILER